MQQFIFSLFFFCLCTYTTHVQAANIDAQGAQSLKTSFQEILDYQKTTNEVFGGLDITYEGEVSVVPKDDTFYEITLPRMIFQAKTPTTDPENTTTPAPANDNDSAFDLGIIKINAMPDDKPGYWKTTITIPQTMTLSDNNPEDVFTVSFEKQNIIGIFSDKLGYFTKMNAQISDVKFKLGGEDIGTSIGGLQVYSNLDETQPNIFSGPGYFSLTDFVIAPPDDNEKIKMEELKVAFNIFNFNFPTLKEYQEKILKHAKTFENLNKIDQDSDTPSETAEVNGQDVMDMVFDLYDFDMGGFDVEYSVKNFSILSDLEDKQRNFDTLSLENASFAMGFNELKSEKGTFFIANAYDGLSINPEDPEFTAIMPQTMDIDIKAISVPYVSLTNIIATSSKAIAANPESAQFVGLGLIMRLPGVLAKAETALTVEKNGVKNGIYDISLDGNVATDLTAVTGFITKFTSLFKGLDTLISTIESLNNTNAIAKEGEEEKSKTSDLSSMLKTLGTLKDIGKLETATDGKTAYRFDLESTLEGKILLNGQDIKTVFE